MPVVYDSYTDVFGGSPVQPSNVAYSAITLTADLTLVWPQSYLDSPNVVTRIIDVLSESEVGWRLQLPDATQVSVGQDFLIFNRGADNFILSDNSGSPLLSIDTGEAYYFYLTDNSDAAGTWSNIVFGAGTSSADANLLAGYGLLAFNNKLNTNVSVVSTNVTPRTIAATDRASMIIWTGGAAVFNLPSAAVVQNGFYFSVSNQGTGQLNLLPFGSETIDGQANFLINFDETLTLATDGTNWYSLGFGQAPVLSVGAVTIAVGGNTDITVTQQESTYIEQFLTGVLTGNINVIYPATPNNYWFIANQTTGNFTLTIKISAGIGVILPQGARGIFYTDGSNMYNTPTFIDAQFVRFPAGTVSNPGIQFATEPTGFYLSAPASLAITVNGVNKATITNALTTINNALNIVGNTAVTAANTFTVGTGLTSLGGGLTVSLGNTSLVTLSTSGLATLDSALVSTTLDVTGTSTFSVVNAGNTTITGSNTLTVGTGLTTLGGGLTVSTGNTSLTTLSTSGLATLNSASVATTLGVTGASALGDTTITGANTFTVGTGLATLGGGLTLSAGPILNANGTVSAPSYSFGTSPNTGIFLGAGTSVRFALSGSTQFLYDSTGVNYLADLNAAVLGATGAVTFGTGSITTLQRGSLNFLNVSGAPAAPGSGGILYVDAGALMYVGSSGTITTLAIA